MRITANAVVSAERRPSPPTTMNHPAEAQVATLRYNPTTTTGAKGIGERER